MPSALHPPNLRLSKHKVTPSNLAPLSSDTPGAQLPSSKDKNVAVKAVWPLLEALHRARTSPSVWHLFTASMAGHRGHAGASHHGQPTHRRPPSEQRSSRSKE